MHPGRRLLQKVGSARPHQGSYEEAWPLEQHACIMHDTPAQRKLPAEASHCNQMLLGRQDGGPACLYCLALLCGRR